jgi:hypothetical protein
VKSDHLDPGLQVGRVILKRGSSPERIHREAEFRFLRIIQHMLGLLMSVSMDWVCVITQEGKHLHRALGYTAEEAKQKAETWCDQHSKDYPAAIPGEPRLQFQKSS